MTSSETVGELGELSTVLLWQFDMTWALGRDHFLPRLSDAACHHLPDAESWTVRRDEAGDWHGDWHMPEPEGLPPPSLAWQTWHLIMWWTQTLAVVSGEPTPAPVDVLWPGSAAATVSTIHGLANTWRAAGILASRRFGPTDELSVDSATSAGIHGGLAQQ